MESEHPPFIVLELPVSFVLGGITASEGTTASTEVRGALEEYTWSEVSFP
jgi:hypothetical protein